MEIKKILNNNVCVVETNGVEQVVMGRGLAYQKRVGDFFDDALVDKTFTLNQEANSMLQELIVDVPIEHITLVDEFITYAKMHIAKKMNDLIYISLIDHISTAIRRYEEGVVVKNGLLWEVKRFYKDEFELGLQALEIIALQTGNTLPEDEAAFIALHLVNSQLVHAKNEKTSMIQITEIIQELSSIVKYTFNIEFDEDSVYFYRFITHLKFFAERVLNQDSQENIEAEGLLDLIKVKYVDAYLCVLKIQKFIEESYDYSISPEEVLYLTIHIERITSVSKK